MSKELNIAVKEAEEHNPDLPSINESYDKMGIDYSMEMSMKTEIEKAEEFNPDSPLFKELSLMASLIDQIGRDNSAATRGEVKIRLAAQVDRLLGAKYAAPKWISVETELPNSNQWVFALIKLMSGKLVPIVAVYTKGDDIVVDDEFMEDSEYVNHFEQRGESCLKEGFYEVAEQVSGEFDECYLRREVIYWLPTSVLPQPPKV